MAVDITNINNLTFGVNYLSADMSEAVTKLWKSRFADEEAFLIDADPNENPKDTFQKFRKLLVQMGQGHMKDKPCILTFFVDYTAELQDAAAAAIWNLKNVFEGVLGCNVQAVMQFAYIGEKGLDETTIQRANIRKALEKNNEKAAYENFRLCLIGKSALECGEGHWKAAIVFLDLLRRSSAVENCLPMAGDLGRNNVCFLRYGEFNENRYQELVDTLKELMALLSNTDSNKLRSLVEKKRNEMVSALEAAYSVDGSLHPQHPDMVVEDPSGFVMPWATNTRAAAKKGNNPAYSNAQRHTRAAVEATGEKMAHEIADWFDQHIAEVDETLKKLLDEGSVGIRLKLNPVEMQSALYLPAYPDPGTMPKLALKYSENGVAEEIGAYLDFIKKNSISIGLRKYTAALQGAFEKIPQDTFQQQKRELERERDMISQKLSEALDAEDFCKKVTLENPSESVFETNTEMNVRNAKFLLCRNRDLETANKAAALGSIVVHHVDEHMCGIVSFDDAPLKAVMIECVDCKEWVLDQLLPEVNYGI